MPDKSPARPQNFPARRDTFRPAAIGIRHPRAGLITLQLFQLRLVDQPDLVAVVQVPASPTSLARVSSLLAAAKR